MFKLKKRPPPAMQQYFIVRQEVVRRTGRVLAAAAAVRDKVARDWGHQYEFGFDQKFTPGHVIGRVWVEGETAEQAGVTVWHLLSKGTRVRYAQLSDDWKSATVPGLFRTGQGQGHVVGVNKGRPEPGITGRGWDVIANEDTDWEMDDAIPDGYAAGAKKI